VGHFSQVPGAKAGLVAFVLTVLLGAGGVAAHALWQQSATAALSVSAAGSWPGPAITALTCTNNASHKTATLHLQLPRDADVTYTAAASPLKIYPWAKDVKAGTTATLDLTETSQVYADNLPGTVTLQVTATYADQTDASAQLTLTFGSNGKIDCPA
jgi:hypothetical protein